MLSRNVPPLSSSVGSVESSYNEEEIPYIKYYSCYIHAVSSNTTIY